MFLEEKAWALQHFRIEHYTTAVNANKLLFKYTVQKFWKFNFFQEGDGGIRNSILNYNFKKRNSSKKLHFNISTSDAETNVKLNFFFFSRNAAAVSCGDQVRESGGRAISERQRETDDLYTAGGALDTLRAASCKDRVNAGWKP